MSSKDNISDTELKNIAPLLSEIQKERPIVPSGYFESLEERVLLRIKEEPTPIQSIKTGGNKVLLWAMAAGVALMVGLFLTQSHIKSGEQRQDVISELEVDLQDDMDFLLAIEETVVLEVYLDVNDSQADEDLEFLLDGDIELEDYLNEEL